MSLQDLAREYAALKPDWAQLGMKCVDPVTGDFWRRVEHVWVRNNPGTMLWFDANFNLFPDNQLAASANMLNLMRAIAAGPDLDDKATLGALLLGLPVDARPVYRQGVWSWLTRYEGTAHASDEAEAVINACIAQAKGKP